jgi:penicillin amidase
VYASTTGEIGYAAAGVIPARDGTGGAWTGVSRADATAYAIDPAPDFIVTANNAIGGAAPPMSTSFDPPYRAARITELIESETALSLEDVARMQLDVVSAQPRALAPLLFDRVEPVDHRSAAALAMLRAWDGGMRAGSAEAVLYQRYYAEAARALFRDELGDSGWNQYRGETAALARAMDGIARRGGGAWCDDVDLPDEQSCGQTLGGALARAVDALSREQGSHMPAWRWDASNVVRFPHAPMDAVGLLRPLFSRALQRPGDPFTVNPSMRIRDQTLVASYRQIIDVGDWDNSRFVMPMGQSGHPISAHYADLLRLWNDGEYVPMTFSEPAVRAAAWSVLTLRPRAAQSSSAYIPRGN